MTVTDYERIVYCMKLWIKEIQEDSEETNMETNGKRCVEWIVATWENEIHDGTYCEDEEYNEYLITGKV